MFNNSKGISLIEVLVGLGLMAIISTGFMTMMENQNKSSKNSQITFEANDFMTQAQTVLLDVNSCSNTLKDNEILVSGPSIEILDIKNAANQPLFSKNSNISPNLKIMEMRIEREVENRIKFYITFKKINPKGSIGSETLRRELTLTAFFPSPTSNIISKCYSQLNTAVDTAKQEICQSLCPTCWDDSIKKCRFYRNPISGEILSKNSPIFNVSRKTCFGGQGGTSKCNPCDSSESRSNDDCYYAKTHPVGARRVCIWTCTQQIIPVRDPAY